MIFEAQGTFKNYYEILGVPENALSSDIQAALDRYRESLEAQVNNPLLMRSARSALNEIVPAIQQNLLTGDNARAEYDQKLAASRRKQTRQFEPADDEGLDEGLRIPFLFKPFEDFDTEMPGFTLRLIAMKLDQEWESAQKWLTDTSDETHSFISYLTFVANRKRLAQRIGNIIEAVSRNNGSSMNVNEGIERCIDILDPKIERPTVGILNTNFDGKMLDAGNFISDLPARTELILGHEGVRGCVFGTIESRTGWVSFEGARSSIRFALMPEGTEPAIGASELKAPLIFQVGNLVRNADHTALLVLHMENFQPAIEIPIRVLIHMLPLPPRVAFEPEASSHTPVIAGTTLRGQSTSVVVTPRNFGDEALVPLVAAISTNDNAARATPAQFHANEPITLSIDTSNRPFGKPYDIVFVVDYKTPDAVGPTSIYVRGEILPTPWQSLLRERSFGERLGIGCLGGIAGYVLLGLLGIGLAAHGGLAWLLFLLIPLLFVAATRLMVSTSLAHMQRSGNTNARLERIPPWVLWGIPIGVGLLFALTTTLISNAGPAFTLGGWVGGIVGLAIGFMLDKAQPAKTDNEV